MSAPSLLSPWFVVFKLSDFNFEAAGYKEVVYYQSVEEGDASFTKEPKRAMLFATIQQASRIASSEGARVMVLTSKEDADEFAR